MKPEPLVSCQKIPMLVVPTDSGDFLLELVIKEPGRISDFCLFVKTCVHSLVAFWLILG